MASGRSSWSSIANGVKSAASCTAGTMSNSGQVFKYAAKAVVGAAGGAATGTVVASTTGALALKAIGFHTVGPAAGSYAAPWMQSAAIVNGGGVAAGSLYSAIQSTSRSGRFFLGAPAVLAVGAVGGVAVRSFSLRSHCCAASVAECA